MSVTEDVVRILQSRGRQEGGTEDAGADINNLHTAVRELQDAEGSTATASGSSTALRLRTRPRPAAPVRTVEP